MDIFSHKWGKPTMKWNFNQESNKNRQKFNGLTNKLKMDYFRWPKQVTEDNDCWKGRRDDHRYIRDPICPFSHTACHPKKSRPQGVDKNVGQRVRPFTQWGVSWCICWICWSKTDTCWFLHPLWLVVEPYPAEQYESQLGLLFPIYGRIKHVPNHQPDLFLHLSTEWMYSASLWKRKLSGMCDSSWSV